MLALPEPMAALPLCMIILSLEESNLRDKFAPRAKKDTLVGFEGDEICRVWIPQDHKVSFQRLSLPLLLQCGNLNLENHPLSNQPCALLSQNNGLKLARLESRT